jgi:hypothetical protein
MGEEIISRTDADIQKGLYLLAHVTEKYRQLEESGSCYDAQHLHKNTPIFAP